MCVPQLSNLLFSSEFDKNSLFLPAKNARQLRSSNSYLLFVPIFKTNIGSGSFSVTAPTYWNSIPEHVKSTNTVMESRRQLKTYLLN